MRSLCLLTYKITLFLYLSSGTVFSQWETGIAYSVKNQYPFNGISVFLERRLPYQGAVLGINFRAAFEHFTNLEKFFPGEELLLKTCNSNIELNILVNFFHRYLKPFTGLGIGTGNYSADKFEITNNKFIFSVADEWKFITKLFAGFKLTFNEYFQPFFQLHLLKFFGSLEEVQFNREIKSVQLGGSAGLSFVLF